LPAFCHLNQSDDLAPFQSIASDQTLARITS
jgi:hypothetical protein